MRNIEKPSLLEEVLEYCKIISCQNSYKEAYYVFGCALVLVCVDAVRCVAVGLLYRLSGRDPIQLSILARIAGRRSYCYTTG
jgi:hypothetical protein